MVALADGFVTGRGQERDSIGAGQKVFCCKVFEFCDGFVTVFTLVRPSLSHNYPHIEE